VPRVIGIDPGTVSLDLCGLQDGAVFLDRSLPTADALANPAIIVGILDEAHRTASLDLVAGPSGYGLPLTRVSDLTDADLRLAYLAAEGESGGIGGLRALMRALRQSAFPIVLTPGVIHLPSVPPHRKVNRVDMGTADKVCAVALAVHEQAERQGCLARDVSLILLEPGGAPPERSMARWRTSPGRCRSICSSAAEHRRSPAPRTPRLNRLRVRARRAGTWRGRRIWRAP
jgi:predicted butyrate kinase (DUF1464 family)